MFTTTDSYNSNALSWKLGPDPATLHSHSKSAKGIRTEEMPALGQHVVFVKILQLVYPWDSGGLWMSKPAKLHSFHRPTRTTPRPELSVPLRAAASSRPLLARFSQVEFVLASVRFLSTWRLNLSLKIKQRQKRLIQSTSLIR